MSDKLFQKKGHSYKLQDFPVIDYRFNDYFSDNNSIIISVKSDQTYLNLCFGSTGFFQSLSLILYDKNKWKWSSRKVLGPLQEGVPKFVFHDIEIKHKYLEWNVKEIYIYNDSDHLTFFFESISNKHSWITFEKFSFALDDKKNLLGISISGLEN
jgi:hypothetical protein